MTPADLFARLHEQPPDRAEATARTLRGAPPRVAVSACLLGIACRYDGGTRPVPGLADRIPGDPLPLCPEVLAGLGTPRPPMVFESGDGEGGLDGAVRLLDSNGRDRSAALRQGVARALDLAHAAGVTHAVLKARSPSCGVHQVHTGEGLIAGRGMFTAACLRAGLRVRSDEDEGWPFEGP